MVTNDINVPLARQSKAPACGAPRSCGNPATYVNEHGRIRFMARGATSISPTRNRRKLNYRNDSRPMMVSVNFLGPARPWHTLGGTHQDGCVVANSKGMVISDCRFRNTIAERIKPLFGCNSCIVTQLHRPEHGDDSFPMWPATYAPAVYPLDINVITHCTAQSPFFANGGAIYGGISNRSRTACFRTFRRCRHFDRRNFSHRHQTRFGEPRFQRCDLNRCAVMIPAGAGAARSRSAGRQHH